MDIKVRLLESREQAVAVARCVYAAHGLTYHRHWLYEPDRVLANNRAGHVRSFVAMMGDRCVAHAAALTPSFELQQDGKPIRGERVRELGLMIVAPGLDQSAVRAQLVSVIYGWAMEQGLEGLIMRCPTDTTAEQRLLRAMGAIPTAIHLGSVPTPLARGHEEPLSVVSYYLPLQPAKETTVFLPQTDRDLYGAVYDALGEPRQLTEAVLPPLAAATSVRVEFDSVRQRGMVHVTRAGPDVEERVLERVKWLLGGRIRHVSVSVPLSSPYIPGAVAAWKGHGLCFSGILPGVTPTGDALMLQGIRDIEIYPEQLKLLDPLSQQLRDRAMMDFEGSRDIRRPASWMEMAS